MTRRVLLVDDDREVREALGQTLELADLEPVLAGSFVEAKDLIAPGFDGVIVSDIRMPGRDGFHLLDHAGKVDADLPVILLTGEGDIPMAVRAIREGAFSFLEKPCAPREFLAAVETALKARALVLDNRRMKRELEQGDAAARMLIGHSDQAKALRAQVRAVARTGAEVLVTGAPGTGTPKIAEVIHLLSPVARAPFVKRAAGSLGPDALAEALEDAQGGTLYLDEVAQLSPAAQFALLDRLETGASARVVAGATGDPGSEGLSPDLYHRLDLMRVRVPSLEERKEDIPLLFRHYLAQACEQANLPEPPVSEGLMARLMAQDWPGNARALMNAAMRLAVGLPDIEEGTPLGLTDQMAKVERTLLISALERAGGNATETARALQLPRKTLYDKLARHGIRAEDYRKD